MPVRREAGTLAVWQYNIRLLGANITFLKRDSRLKMFIVIEYIDIYIHISGFSWTKG